MNVKKNHYKSSTVIIGIKHEKNHTQEVINGYFHQKLQTDKYWHQK